MTTDHRVRRGPRLGPTLRWPMLLAGLAIGLAAAARAAEPPIQLAERTLDLDGAAAAPQTEIIEIEGVDNRFGSLVLETLNGRFAIQTVRVTLDEGGQRGIGRTLAVDKVLTPREPIAEVVVSETEARLRRIEVDYRSADSGASGKALLRVSARRHEGGRAPAGTAPPVTAEAAPRPAAPRAPAVPQTAPPAADASAGVERAASLVSLASRTFPLSSAEITIRLAGDPTVSVLQLRVGDTPLIVRKAVAKLASGEVRDLEVAELIEAGGASRIVDVARGGAPVKVREVTVSIRRRTGSDQGKLDVLGDAAPRVTRPDPAASRPERPSSAAAPPPPVHAGPEPRAGAYDFGPRRPLPSDRQRFETGWRLLGAARDQGRTGRRALRRATFTIRDEGQIGAVRFLARRDVIRIMEARVLFEDGESRPLEVDGYELEPGQMTEVLGTRSRGRAVVRVDVIYRPLETFVGEAVLELWAQVTGPPPPGTDRERVRVIPPPPRGDEDDPDEE